MLWMWLKIDLGCLRVDLQAPLDRNGGERWPADDDDKIEKLGKKDRVVSD